MNRLSGGLERCFKGWLLLVLLAGVGFTTGAEENIAAPQPSHRYQLSTEDLELIQAGQDILSQQGLEEMQQLLEETAPSSGQSNNRYRLTAEDLQLIQQGQELKKKPLTPPDQAVMRAGIQLRQQPLSKIDQQLVTRGQQIAAASVQAKLPATRKTQQTKQQRQPQVLLFASQSLRKQGLEELLEAAAHTPNTTVVLRGIAEGMTLGEGLKWIQRLAAKQQPVPSIILDPQLFRTYQVTTVPTLVLLKPGSVVNAPQPETLVARVQGIHDPRWLLRQVAQGHQGDLGVQGPLAEIKEPDLITVMQSRVMAIDWEQKKQAALEHFWQQPRFCELAPAPKTRRRAIDPTVVVTETIKTQSGRVIATQGSRLNPLTLRPFTQALVIFDPLNPQQQPLIRQALTTIKAQHITYIATRFDREAGWPGYEKITEQLQAPVYLLTPDVLERFELQYTPSIVTAQGQQFVVQELADAP